MPSSRREKQIRPRGKNLMELCDFNQLGLDFASAPSYSMPPRKEMELMNQELIEALEKKIGEIIEKYNNLKDENVLLTEEVERLSNDRESIKSRVDALLGKLDGI